MATRSRPMYNGHVEEERSYRYRPQVIPRGCVANAALLMLWFVAFILLVISTIGNYVLFLGGWEFARWPLDERALWALLYACILQGICSLAQWGFKAIRLWFAYAVALLISAIPSFLTYNAGIGPMLWPLIGFLAPAVILVVVIFVDMLPEWILVR